MKVNKRFAQAVVKNANDHDHAVVCAFTYERAVGIAYGDGSPPSVGWDTINWEDIDSRIDEYGPPFTLMAIFKTSRGYAVVDALNKGRTIIRGTNATVVSKIKARINKMLDDEVWNDGRHAVSDEQFSKINCMQAYMEDITMMLELADEEPCTVMLLSPVTHEVTMMDCYYVPIIGSPIRCKSDCKDGYELLIPMLVVQKLHDGYSVMDAPGGKPYEIHGEPAYLEMLLGAKIVKACARTHDVFDGA